MTQFKTNVKLPSEVKKKWVDALRSGAYKQGDGLLIYDDGYDTTCCCLGVLGVICGIPTEEMQDVEFLNSDQLGNEVLNKTPLPKEFLENEELQEFLGGMNDGVFKGNPRKFIKWNFSQIADWIEENL